MDSHPLSLNASLEICKEAFFNPPSWYVMRFLFNHRGNTMQQIEKRKMTFFTPMHTVKRLRGNRTVERDEPVIRSLLFIHSDYRSICELRQSNSYLQFRYVRGGGMHQPMIVKKKEMEEFIHFSTYGEDPVFFDASNENFRKGDRIRILRGPLSGHEAILKKLPGKRARRAVVDIEGVLAVGVKVDLKDVEKI